MNMFENIKEELMAQFSDWIQVVDSKSKWTIEEFPYDEGVNENRTRPHCWKCVTINQCWFVDQENKRPQEFDYSKYSIIDMSLTKKGLYHPNCHDQKLKILTPSEEQIKFIIPPGKPDWMIRDKGHLLKAMGYKEQEFLEAVNIIKNLVAIEYVNGNYNFRTHDKTGFKISFLINFPGRNEDYGKIYKLKTG